VIYQSRIRQIGIPDVFVHEHVLARALEFGSRPAMIDSVTGETVTYADLYASVQRLGAGFEFLGVRPGDVVALMSHNQPSFALALLGAQRAGAAVSPINPLLTTSEIATPLRKSAATVLVASENVAAKALEAAEAANAQPAAAGSAAASSAEAAGRRAARVVVIGQHTGCISFADLLAADARQAPKLSLDPAVALAALPFSSGTTGVSKGVMLTHRNLVANLEQFRMSWRLSEGDVLCGALPMFHIYGLTVILSSSLLAGSTLVTMPRYDLGSYLQVVQDYGITRGHFVPPIVLQLAQSDEVSDYDLSSMTVAVCGAAPLDEEVASRAEARIGCMIRQGYGMTEASPGTHLAADDDFESTPAGAAGRLMPATEARLVSPATGADVGPSEVGELLVRGPQVMAGYLGDPVSTAETITDGWLHTGDLARVDGDMFTIVDRVKELIKYNGFQVAPAELEALLLSHPDVEDAAVVGAPDPGSGEIPKAFLVTSRPVDPDAVMAWVAERVAPHKKVRAVEFVDAIPRSPTGKILRRTLKATVTGKGAGP
jgi:acyl-CoA synthetase (AMP-forming)/AMP-acid ligase II